MSEEENIKLPLATDQEEQPEVIITAEENALPNQETIATEIPNTNIKLQTEEEMEVHHHTHAGHGKKNWKSYFWEFLMLFLAVFCGFLAEYQLEHKIERDREKQYVQSLINDLKADIINIESNQKRNLLVEQRGDSLFQLLTLPDYSKSTNSIYYFGRLFSTNVHFTMTDGTIKQLNNSGGLRLIKDKNLVDNLQVYQNIYSEILKLQELKEIQLQSYRDVMCKLFDIRIFETMVSGVIIKRPDGTPALFSQNKELINELLMKSHFVKRNNASLVNKLEELKQHSLNLQKIIYQEYRLK